MMNLTEINVNGAGISLGHPIACTGTRVLITLLHEMERWNSRYGLEYICGGGGALPPFSKGYKGSDG
jgi:acetyl-CoA C-acetyltransferase